MSVLDQILQSTRRRVEEARAGADLRELERSAGEHEVRGSGGGWWRLATLVWR